MLTAHHWADLDAGLGEMLRVARERIVTAPFDAEALEGPLDHRRLLLGDCSNSKRPSGADAHQLLERLPAAVASPLPVPRDCTDHFFAALWARPELLFEEEVVRPMWVWQGISERSRRAGRERLASDLQSGAWEERYGHLRERKELDCG